MKEIDRRQFIKIVGAGLGLTALGVDLTACNTNPPPREALAANVPATAAATAPAKEVTPVVPTATHTPVVVERVITATPVPTSTEVRVTPTAEAGRPAAAKAEHNTPTSIDVELKRNEEVKVTAEHIKEGLVIVQGDVDIFDLNGSNRFRTYDTDAKTGSLGVMLAQGIVHAEFGGDVTFGEGCDIIKDFNLLRSKMEDGGCEDGCQKGVRIWLWNGKMGRFFPEQEATKIIDQVLADRSCRGDFATPRTEPTPVPTVGFK